MHLHAVIASVFSGMPHNSALSAPPPSVHTVGASLSTASPRLQINTIAASLGLNEDEFELYGIHKAKVHFKQHGVT